MPALLPRFPVNEVTVSLLREALGASLDGSHGVTGAEFSMPRLLEMLSPPVPDVAGCQVVYTRDDVIAALLDELDRLSVGRLVL